MLIYVNPYNKSEAVNLDNVIFIYKRKLDIKFKIQGEIKYWYFEEPQQASEVYTEIITLCKSTNKD